MTAPIPRHEAARLGALRDLQVLDTRREDFSDAVAAAAASIANVPMSALSLVDADRQWFKGAVGLAARETHRADAFCAHAILEEGPMVVTDARGDARFATNPHVAGAPHVRFYAGFPLQVNGHAVGALCVLDDRPRTLSDDQLSQLRSLADVTQAWLAISYPPRAV